jgi:hypothetical protein
MAWFCNTGFAKLGKDRQSGGGFLGLQSVNEQLGTIQTMLQMQRFLSESEERSLLNGSTVFN